MENKIFKILLDDYSTPSFVTAAKEYYGTLEDIKNFIKILENMKNYKHEYSDTVNAFHEYMQGNKKVKHTVAYQENTLLTSVDIICEERQNLQNKEWNHTNIWGCAYTMKLNKAKIKHYWIKDNEGYCRIVKAQIYGLCYKGINDEFVILNNNFWGFPGILVCNNNIIHNNLACIEKRFDSLDELFADHQNFLKNSDVNFEKICDDIFGDG